MPQPRPLRIAFVADCLDGEVGGGVISARRFVDQLRKENDVFVIGTSAKDMELVKMQPMQLPFSSYKTMNFTVAWPDRAAIREALKTCDVVHLQFPFLLSYVALDEAKKLGKPVVAAMHVQPENLFYNVGVRSKWLAKKMYQLWVNHYYSRADQVVVPTEFAAEKLRSYGLKTPITVVSNGFSPHIKRGFYKRQPDEEGHFLIASVGRYAWEKRQDILIEAVRRSKYADRIKIVMAGCGPREEELRRLGATLPNPPEMGYLSLERLQQALNTADLFVHCSEVELEGMSVLDAMHVGLPCLISNCSESAASRFALDARFQFCGAQELAARIDHLMDNPIELREGREHSRNTVKQFVFGDNVSKLLNVYRDLRAPEFAASI